MVLQYYAHVRESANDNKKYQTVAQHLTGTAELCRGFAAAFGADADGELAGLAHDIGKCTEEFQNRLLNDGPIVDHATAGAMACAGKPLCFRLRGRTSRRPAGFWQHADSPER